MSKTSTIFACAKCSAQSPKWSGRCFECGGWGTLKEELKATNDKKPKNDFSTPAEIIDLNTIKLSDFPRTKTNISEVDRVLGGGIVAGSLILISGEPGIGKSTIIAQIANKLQGNTIYASGEESAHQVKDRLIRLSSDLSKIKFISETNINKIISSLKQNKVELLIIDSVQTVYADDIENEIGTINQIKACTAKLMEFAKSTNIPVILVGHVTKDGAIAGPKNLEHMVDVVVYFESDDASDYRILRANKNRFGSTNEVGIFEMASTGFNEIKNPSLLFINKNQENLPGSVKSCIIEGTRPFLVEIQALVTKTSFGYPQRKASGFDLNRLQVLIAVLTKRSRIDLSNQDVILNIVGGHKSIDQGLDLAVCAAIISSLKNKRISHETVIIGEVGLAGEVRLVSKLKERVLEANNLGFSRFLTPIGFKNTNIDITEIKAINDLVNCI
ncbi:DNA repair protein RadA [Patescibacteria group bacterium]|nr:DNA repair protein RadA [Patescibacteria group bacterium]